MWRIKYVDIKGLLGRYDIHWDLFPDVNILGGANGSGKSTLLMAIFMMLTPRDHSESVAAHSEAVFENIHAELRNGYQMSVEKSVEISTKMSNENGNKSISQEKISLNFTTHVPEDFSIEAQEGPIVIYINSIEANVRTISAIFSNSAMKDRAATSMLDLMIENRLNQRNALFSESMSKALDSGDETEMKRVQELFGRFSKVLKEFMPDYVIQTMSTLTFTRNGFPNQTIRYYKLSGGEKQLIYLLLSISNTMDNPVIALLDEADMGMHVDWKRMLLKQLFVLNPNMQIITSTHSPALVDGWRDRVKEIGQICINA